MRKPNTVIFSPTRFGAALRRRRKECGYRSAQKFSDGVYEKTGVSIDLSTVERIERGEREPDTTKLMAMCVTLYGVKWDKYLVYLLRESMADELLEYDASLQNEEAAKFFERLKRLAESAESEQ